MNALDIWERRFRSAASRTLGDGWDSDPLQVIASFEDEAGFRPLVAGWLLAWMFRSRIDTVDARRAMEPAAITGQADCALWCSLASGYVAPVHQALAAGDTAPLLRLHPETSIEVRTESELSALHALWHLAGEAKDTDLRARCLRAARWHVDTLQPDNATNHPWAIHVFAVLGAAGDTEASLYAQTLLHNAQVSLGRPDRLSAVILLDAADAVRAEIESTHSG
jgi:hypothetical protein